ncbi:MAG: chemotaxis protein CheB [Rhodocyclaceae bacterium]|nr:chemotaxis protein CheB [Rhodocyclaceae bacterium]MDZ4214557.1 chemotaxis protein CheB [Rhodocyclaceae bacterium]
MSNALIIAGIGASAGGLEAMLPLFAAMPATGRIAYIVAQHMAKDGHDELVVRLIGRESALPVMLAEDGALLAADTVYVIPSGKDGRVKDGRLVLSEPLPTHLSTPSVNALFASLAEYPNGKGIGIVLSGTGSDGVNGCRAIKAAGGLTLAQDLQEAKFDGMPGAAIAAGVVELVLPVAAIGDELARRFPGVTKVVLPKAAVLPAPTFANQPPPASAELRELEQLLKQVHQATKIDFSSYKEDTLLRRLEKRKSTLGIESAAAYQDLIRRQPEELKVLQHLFLVSVSSFFRDAESFKVLKMSLAKLASGKPAGEPVRVWVPGCASGEEPYTLAILLRELSELHPVEITATDLNPEALAMCREGVYRQTAFKEMDAPLRDKYFLPKGQHFELKPEIKACVRFEQRDVLSGTPPTNLDLLSCRNLLIYMKSHLQDQLIKSFHQALRSQGLLFIGQSESLSFVGNSLFVPIDHYHRLFRKRH